MENTPAEQNTAFFRFEELRVYHKALDYITWVHRATSDFSDETNDNLGIKFNEVARAIATNIAEGSSRNKSQFIYYLKMAKSSVREALVLTSISFNLEYLDEKLNTESRGYLMEMTKMIELPRSYESTDSMIRREDDMRRRGIDRLGRVS